MSTPYPTALPSRTGPITTIVIGVLAMILGPLIGVIISVSGVVSNLDIEDLSNSAQTVPNGATVTLGAGEWMVIPEGAGGSYGCDIGGPGQISTRTMEGIVVFTTTQSGQFTIDCGVSGSLVLTSAADIEGLIDAAPGFAGAFLGGMAVGFIGFVLLVVGIIWLVRVNQRRRATQMGSWGGGFGGGYQQPGYQPQGYQQPGYQPPAPGSYPPPAPGSAQPPAWPAQPSDPWTGQPQPPRYGERIDPNEPRPGA